MDSASPEKAKILDHLNAAIDRARKYASTYRYWDIRLLIGSIVFGALATCLAGGMASLGQGALDQTFGKWTYLCFAIAGLTAIGTITGTMHKTMRISDRVSDAERCIARLGSLKFLIDANLIDPKEAAKDFTQICNEHSEPLALRS